MDVDRNVAIICYFFILDPNKCTLDSSYLPLLQILHVELWCLFRVRVVREADGRHRNGAKFMA